MKGEFLYSPVADLPYVEIVLAPAIKGVGCAELFRKLTRFAEMPKDFPVQLHFVDLAAGINIIHINTELRVAWRHGLEEGLSKQPNEVVPYKILPYAVDAVEKVARSRLKLFNAAT